MINDKHPSEKALIAEYSAAHDAYLHYDGYSWQVGVVLIAGTFVFWGFLLDKAVTILTFTVSSLLITLFLSVWLLYTNHNRQIYLSKLHRIHELEEILSLEQHRRWRPEYSNLPISYKTFGPRGHFLDKCIYCIASLCTPLIGFAKLCFDIRLIIPFPFVIIILNYISLNESLLLKHLQLYRRKHNTDK